MADDTKKEIDIYEAIRQMRTISSTGGTFSMKFRKWNRTSRNGGDMCNIAHARIRPKAADDVVSNSSYKLFFTDTDSGRPMNCWQPLLVEFNGMKTVFTKR